MGVMIVEFIKLHFASSPCPLPPLPLFVPTPLSRLSVLPYTDFQLSRSDNTDTQVECDEHVAFEHPDYNVVVHGYELFVSYDGGEEVVVVRFGEGGRDGGQDPWERWDFRVRELKAELGGKGREAIWDLSVI